MTNEHETDDLYYYLRNMPTPEFHKLLKDYEKALQKDMKKTPTKRINFNKISKSNPYIREHSNFRERGLKKFHYTYKDISDLSGLKINTIQHLKLSGSLDPDKLRNIVNFIISKQESFRKEILYNELLAAVKSRVSDRSKHKTALRYIREKEKTKVSK